MTIKTWDIRLQELAGVLPEDISEDVAGWKFNDMEKCMKAEIDELRTALAAAEARIDPKDVYLDVKDQCIAELEMQLKFVERWANHHGVKPHMTAESTLGIIQHYPPIKAITKAYIDGKVPETPDPWERIAELETELLGLRTQEPVAWRYHSVSPFAKDGEWAVSKKWSLIHAPNQRDAHSASCGMVAEPLYAAAGAKP